MADYPVIQVPNKVGALLDYVRKVNRPTKVTRQWLEAGGFKSKNDRAFGTLLKALGYTDGSGTPTDKWAELRGSEPERRASMGRQMAVAYPEIFAHYPVEAIAGLGREDLKNFIRPRVSAGEPTVENIAATFLALVAQADLSASAKVAAAPQATPQVAPMPVGATIRGTSQGGIAMTINLSLEIPPTSDADIYDKLFAAMAKHLGELLDRGS